MKSKAIISAVVVAYLGAQGSLAFAQDYHHKDDHRPPPHAMQHHPDRGPGAGPYHNFHRGDRLAAQYRNRQFRVDNWREHHLSAPPRGYHWVQTGADYVLVAAATGIIAQIVLGNR